MTKVISVLGICVLSSILVANEVKQMDENLTIEKPVVNEGNSTQVFDIALKYGTLGLGIDISTAINDKTNMRFNYNGLTYSRNEVIDDIDYTGDLKLSTFGVLVDYYPGESTFRLTGGAYKNGNEFTGVAKPSGTTNIDINGVQYGVQDIGQLNTVVTFNSISPYIGIGWGNDTRDKGWSFSFDLGAMYHGTPKSDLEVVINNPIIEAQIRDDVEKEKQQLEDDIASFKIYPVIRAGVSYTF